MTHASDPISTRLREGFERIALVLRADLWLAAGTAGLNPTQAQVLSLLATRPAGLRPKEIAAHLAVSAASMADTLAALERKGLLRRTPDPSDARALIACLAEDGLIAGRTLAASASQVTTALRQLTAAEQGALLAAQIKIIRALQQAGAIPVQRLCVSCRHFRPNAHPGEAVPHHCAFIDAAIGDRDLRLDCGDHEEADPAAQAATWTAFTEG